MCVNLNTCTEGVLTHYTIVYFSGDSYPSLTYLFRVDKSTIAKFIPEVAEAIYKVLREEYLKVSEEHISTTKKTLILI